MKVAIVSELSMRIRSWGEEPEFTKVPRDVNWVLAYGEGVERGAYVHRHGTDSWYTCPGKRCTCGRSVPDKLIKLASLIGLRPL